MMDLSEANVKLGRAVQKIFGFDLVFLMQDSLYVMKRDKHWPEYQDKVNDMRDKFKNSMIAGGAFGMALIFSLRRYFPNHLSNFTVNKILVQSIILCGCFFGSSISVLLGASKFVHAVKKDYVLKADPNIYQYLQDFKTKYQVDQETQIRYLLSTEEFEEWKKYRHQMVV